MRQPMSSFQKGDLIWECVKKNNCFLKKFNNVTLTRDPLNLVGIHKKKFNGLSGKGVGLKLAQHKIFLVKNKNQQEKPVKNIAKKSLSFDQSVGTKQAAKFLQDERRDLLVVIQQCLSTVAKQSHA